MRIREAWGQHTRNRSRQWKSCEKAREAGANADMSVKACGHVAPYAFLYVCAKPMDELQQVSHEDERWNGHLEG